MTETTPGGVDAADDSRAAASPGEPVRPPLRLFPPYAVVLILTAGLSVLIASKGADAWHAARAAGSYPEETRREILFALVFSWAVLAALAAAWLGELVATVVRLARRVPAGRALARLGLTLLPLLVFGIGHRLVNPWLFELVSQVRQLGAGPAG